MFFQIDYGIASFILTLVFSIALFIINIFIMRWYARKKKKKSYQKDWDTSLMIAFKVNLIFLIIDIPVVILFKFLFAEILFLNLVIQFYIYLIINLCIGTIGVAVFYRKKIGEAFDFIVIVQLIIFLIALVLVFAKALILIPPYIFLYILINGLPTTLLLTVLGLMGGFLIGLSLAIMRVYGSKELTWLASGYEKLFRGIPILILIFIFAFGMPGLFWFLAHPLNRIFASVVLALALRSGAYQSQIFRGAILSVNIGQMQAARALGMSHLKALQYVVLPQALRLALPGWSNEYAVVIKDSSFAFEVGIIEMTKWAYRVGTNNPELWALTMGILAITYFLFTYPVTRMFGERQSKKLKKLGIGGG